MSRDLFDKFDDHIIVKAHQMIPEGVLDPSAVRMDQVHSQTEATIGGKRTILAGTNNYMGMTFNKDALAAAHKALDEFGAGTTGSRVLNGTYIGHAALEDTLKEFYGTDFAMVFSTGYQANLGIISALAGRDDYVIIDADSHASIYDACAMGNATITRFRHNDFEDLDKRLGRLPEDAGKLVVVEGVYSMLGDRAPLKEIVAITKKHNAAIAVDEAHSMGFCGATGRGITQEMGLEDDVDFIIGTFSKSVGTVGGFCVSNHPKFERLRLVCRPYMFTASLPPSVVASARVSIEALRYADNIRGNLWSCARRLHAGLKGLGFSLATEEVESPIIAVCMDDAESVAVSWSELLKAGVYVNTAVPPATPNSLCLLRCSVCAAHTHEQIDQIIAMFAEVAAKRGVGSSTANGAGSGASEKHLSTAG